MIIIDCCFFVVRAQSHIYESLIMRVIVLIGIVPLITNNINCIKISTPSEIIKKTEYCYLGLKWVKNN